MLDYQHPYHFIGYKLIIQCSPPSMHNHDLSRYFLKQRGLLLTQTQSYLVKFTYHRIRNIKWSDP